MSFGEKKHQSGGREQKCKYKRKRKKGEKKDEGKRKKVEKGTKEKGRKGKEKVRKGKERGKINAKTTCCERGKIIIFRRGWGGSISFSDQSIDTCRMVEKNQ